MNTNWIRKEELSKAPDKNGWIKWTGGFNPAPNKLVDIKYCDGFIQSNVSSNDLRWNWILNGQGGDIVEYKEL